MLVGIGSPSFDYAYLEAELPSVVKKAGELLPRPVVPRPEVGGL
jgi:hypothetical protein